MGATTDERAQAEAAKQARLAQLRGIPGLTFADCIEAFGVPRDGDPFASTAHEKYGSDDLEVDDTCVLSQADDGTWVSCWRWITNEEAGVAEDDEGEG